MIIGIDGSRAFLPKRTGIEKYSYQTIKNLRNQLDDHGIVLYLRENQSVDFDLPKNWTIKKINCPRLWTQLGLSFEMFFHPVDMLFVPAHTVPIVHPKKTVVTIHGLEYEFVPQGYSNWARFYMRWTIKKSCQWASTIISVSENTKKDLMELYKVPENKISVIHEGYDVEKSQIPNLKSQINSKIQISNIKPFLLFVGRIEERKNIANIVKAFEILKEKYSVPHKLILGGSPGYGYGKIKAAINSSQFKNDIVELGYISDDDYFFLLQGADVSVFVTLYEGFGIPVLEAQSVGCPVVAGNNSSIPEVADGSALLVDPQNPAEIAENIRKLLSDSAFKDDIMEKGLENVKHFSWEKCAKEVSIILTK
jgi:glycosyltransferase involved in cell wall biosynthesis